MSVIRYAHPTHIDDLFVIGTDRAFYLGGQIKAAFRNPIKGLVRVLVNDDYVTVGGPFNTLEEVYEFIKKEFPNHTPQKVLVNRLVRTRWKAATAA